MGANEELGVWVKKVQKWMDTGSDVVVTPQLIEEITDVVEKVNESCGDLLNFMSGLNSVSCAYDPYYCMPQHLLLRTSSGIPWVHGLRVNQEIQGGILSSRK